MTRAGSATEASSMACPAEFTVHPEIEPLEEYGVVEQVRGFTLRDQDVADLAVAFGRCRVLHISSLVPPVYSVSCSCVIGICGIRDFLSVSSTRFSPDR
jgi:hypothetical protein